MKILILIRSLEPGGAERQAALLARELQARGHQVQVAVFYGGGALTADLGDVPCIDLGKRGRWDNLAFLIRLVRLVRRERPDVVYAFLTVANLLTGLLGPLWPSVKRVWSVRASNMDLRRYDRLTRLTAWLEARLSRTADLIIANSRSGRDFAIAQGFPAGKLRVAPNGIDTGRFRPDRASGAPLRATWGIAPGQVLIGLVGRLDPMKGHPDFLHAAACLRARHAEARFVCVGEGPAGYREVLMRLADDLGLQDCLVWAGPSPDMPAVYNALDIAVSASVFGEGFSNMLGEAMASGTPCVATEVGDAAWVLGETGVIVPLGSAAALADGIEALWARRTWEGEALGWQARRRIEEHFSVSALIDNTLAAFGSLP